MARFKFESNVAGLKELKQQFKAMPKVIQTEVNKATQLAIREAADYAKKEVRANSYATGALHDAITSRMNWKAGRGSFGVARAKTSFGSWGARMVKLRGSLVAARDVPGYEVMQPSRRAHFLEFGTAAHSIKNRKHPGGRAQPFIGPAAKYITPVYLAKLQKAGKLVETKMASTATKGGGYGETGMTIGGRF